MGFFQALNSTGIVVFFFAFWAVIGTAVCVVLAIRSED